MRRSLPMLFVIAAVVTTGCAEPSPVALEIEDDAHAVDHHEVGLSVRCDFDGDREVRFAEDDEWTEWDSFTPERSWRLAAGEGERRVAVECRTADDQGNDADSVIVDATSPNASIERPAAGTVYVEDEAVGDDPDGATRVAGNLTVTAVADDGRPEVDAVAGIERIAIALDGETVAEESFRPSRVDGTREELAWTWGRERQLGDDGPGTHTLTVTAEDHAGNEDAVDRTVTVVADTDDVTSNASVGT